MNFGCTSLRCHLDGRVVPGCVASRCNRLGAGGAARRMEATNASSDAIDSAEVVADGRLRRRSLVVLPRVQRHR